MDMVTRVTMNTIKGSGKYPEFRKYMFRNVNIDNKFFSNNSGEQLDYFYGNLTRNDRNLDPNEHVYKVQTMITSIPWKNTEEGFEFWFRLNNKVGNDVFTATIRESGLYDEE